MEVDIAVYTPKHDYYLFCSNQTYIHLYFGCVKETYYFIIKKVQIGYD